MIGVEQKVTEANIRVQQGCTLSPVVFNLHTKVAMHKLKQKLAVGIEI